MIDAIFRKNRTTHLLAAGLGWLASLAATPCWAWPSHPLETLVLFNPAALENPESVVIDRDGNRYISLALTGEIRKVAADGSQSTLAILPLGPPLTPCGNFVGIMGALAFDAHEQNLFTTVNSCLPGQRGVWKIDLAGNTTLIAPFPDEALINGIARVHDTLYVTDSELGLIWSLPTSGGTPTVWKSDPLLAADPLVLGPGPNGIQSFRGELYVCVSDSNKIIAIRRKANGQPGALRVHADLFPDGCDDFAFDVLGNIWATTDPTNRLLKVRPNGEVEVVLEADDLLDGPTATAFGRHGLDRLRLYIANAAFPFFTTTNRPSLMRYFVGIPGAPR